MASAPTLNHTTLLLTLASSLPLTLLLLGVALLPPILARRSRAPTNRIALALASAGAIALAGIAGLISLAAGGASAGAAGAAFGLLGVLLLDSYLLLIALAGVQDHHIVIRSMLCALLVFSTLLHILLLALSLDREKTTALVALRAVVHVVFDVLIAVLLVRWGRKGGEWEERDKETSRTAAGQQQGRAPTTTTGSIVYHASQDDSTASQLKYRRLGLTLLQLPSVLLFILSAALPTAHDYSSLSLGRPAPTWMGTTTSPAGYVVLALLGVIRWTGVLVDLAVVDSSSLPDDLAWEDEPSLLSAEIAEARQYRQHEHQHQQQRDSTTTTSYSPTDSRTPSRFTMADPQYLRPDSNLDSNVARDSHSLLPSPNPDTHRASLSTMGRPISQVSSFFASTSPARTSTASPFQASRGRPLTPGAYKQHRTHHSLPSLSFPSLSATSSRDNSSRPPRLATPPLLSHSHTSPSPLTSTLPNSFSFPPLNPFTTTTTSSRKSRRPSLSALQLTFDSPTLSFANLRELISPTPKTPGSATLSYSNAPSEGGMELQMGEGEGEDPFARAPSREAMVENWRKRSGIVGGDEDEEVSGRRQELAGPAAADNAGGRVSIVVEEEHERITEEDEEHTAGESGGDYTGNTEYHEVFHTGSGFTTAHYSTPPRLSGSIALGQGRDRSASHTSTRSAFLEEFNRSLATDLHLQKQTDDSEAISHSDSEQEDVYLDPFPAPGSPESHVAKLHRRSEEAKLGLHLSRPTLKAHISAPPRSMIIASSSSLSTSPVASISPPRPTLRLPSISSPSLPAGSGFSLRRLTSLRKNLAVTEGDGDRKSAYSDLSFACVGDQSAGSSIEFEMRKRDGLESLGLGAAMRVAMEGELEEDLVGVERRRVEDGIKEAKDEEQEMGKNRRGPASSTRGSLKRGAWWNRLSSRPTSFIGTPHRARSASSPIPRHSIATSESLKSNLDVSNSASVSGSQTPYSVAGSNALGLEFRLPTPHNLSPLSSMDFGSEAGSVKEGNSDGGQPRSTEQQGAGRPSLDDQNHSTPPSSRQFYRSHQSHFAQPSPQRATSLTSLEELTELVNSFERKKVAEEAQAQAEAAVAESIIYDPFPAPVDSSADVVAEETDCSPSITDSSSLPSFSRPSTSLSFFPRTSGRSTSPSSTSPFFSTASIGRTHTRTISAPLSSPASWRKEYALSNYASTDTESLHLESPISPAFSGMIDSPSLSAFSPSSSPSPSPSPSIAPASPDDLVGYGTLSSPTSLASLTLSPSSTPTSPDFALASWSRATRVRAKRGRTVDKGRARTLSEGMWSPISSDGSGLEEQEGEEIGFGVGRKEQDERERTMRRS